MVGEATEEKIVLPCAELVEVQGGLLLQPPLSRQGHGPGLVVVVPETSRHQHITPDLLPPLQKWAEEGFATVEIPGSALNDGNAGNALTQAFRALEECDTADGDLVAIVVYEPICWNMIAPLLSSTPKIIAAVAYGSYSSGPALVESTIPCLHHLAGTGNNEPKAVGKHTVYSYAKAQSPVFAYPNHGSFHAASESMSHTRNLTFLKKHLGAPFFDLEAIWNEHTAFEFGDRSVARTMETMVAEPYVNHIPTMTGGIGRERLTNFYRHHFIFNNPEDTDLELISRVVGIDRVVDEFVFSFTHTKIIDWILPGIPPTGKHVRVPFTSVVNIRGDRLYHEHIAWDQASVLVQLGLMPEYLPFPYALPDGTKPAAGKKFEYRVPAAGSETANKILDKNSEDSNKMFDFKIREVVI
ncbi:LEA domain protein [Tricladium varicosporioides]|nr:LEA domain protein [Hymenoscyphus varicosporioides]